MKCRIYKIKMGQKEGLLLTEIEINSKLQVMKPGDKLDIGEVTYEVREKRFRLEDGQLILIYNVY